jgi:2-keto-4-pentenoate hydratase/2-oxohepta-3-ene-1,7-dioic acid hydratase in catechol pathway
MKLVLYDDFQLGVLQGERVLPAGAALAGLGYHSPQEMMQLVITGWAELGPEIEKSLAGQRGVGLETVRLRPPLPRPGQLVCLAGNYLEPARPERDAFNAFLKASSSVIGSGETVQLPPAEASVFHFEPELAVVIGKPASHLSQAEALACVFGYTQFMDVSSRGLPGGFFLGKSWHTCGPLGPALVTADEITGPNALSIRLWVNDELRHDFSTGEMARHIPELLVEVTKVMALEPGDVVATGTHHFGLAPVQHGDTVRLAITGLGPALTVAVHDPLGRKW